MLTKLLHWLWRVFQDNNFRCSQRRQFRSQWYFCSRDYTHSQSLRNSCYVSRAGTSNYIPQILWDVEYIPRNMHTVFALLCFVVVTHWLIFPYPSGLLHWHCGNLTIAPVPAKQPWRIWINTSCEFIMNDCITTTKQSTAKPCAYFLGYTVPSCPFPLISASGIQVLKWYPERSASLYHPTTLSQTLL